MGMKEKSLARCCKAVYAALPEENADAVMRGTRRVNAIFSGFVRGKLLDSLIIGILCFICCSILKDVYKRQGRRWCSQCSAWRPHCRRLRRRSC